jgi:hypothetical protein
MRNVVTAAMLVAAGVSSSHANHTGGSDDAATAVAKGKTPSFEGNIRQPIDDPPDVCGTVEAYARTNRSTDTLTVGSVAQRRFDNAEF